ncbi:D-inositol 3-phosphate glycosyltransferase [Stylophora pistillata]|uniref:D-inositol 3-phosphate glycosyltransferase n=1 Tax=Stylophora pistillata TaxID=50429 RepID=A0A2B4REG0_STYPI|nr:D-inositol 3-phosphate glycosyltransferase [Stylophora pistillata]
MVKEWRQRKSAIANDSKSVSAAKPNACVYVILSDTERHMKHSNAHNGVRRECSLIVKLSGVKLIESKAVLTMACSSVSITASSENEKKKHRLIDVMFLYDEWKSSKSGLTTFNREFAINLAETTTGSMKVHCYVSQSDDRDREDAKQHGVNLITAEAIPGSRDPLDWLKVPPPELQHPHVVIGHGRKLGTPPCLIVRAAKCKWLQFVHVFCEDLEKSKKTTTPAVDTIEENEEKHKMEIELCKAADAVVAVGSRLQRKYSRSLLNVKVEVITPGIFGKFSSESQLAVDRSVVKHFNVFMFGRGTFEDLYLKGYDIVANTIDSLAEQEELKVIFYQSDLVALPSRTEGFGLVSLEAICAGVPILVSGESSIAEALQKVEGGNAVIVGSDEDADEWAGKIREMSEESIERREAGAMKFPYPAEHNSPPSDHRGKASGRYSLELAIAIRAAIANASIPSQETHTSGEGEVRCRLCGKAPESVAHILSGCSALAQSKYLSRQDAALKVLFYELLYDEGVIDEIPPWYSPDKPKPVYESENVKAYWDVPIYADQQEVRCNRVDARIVNHMCKRVVTLEMSCPWVNNRTRKDEEKTLKYGPLRWELRQQFPGYEVKQYNIIMDALGGWSRELDVMMRELVGGRSTDVLRKMQRAVLSGTLNIARTFKVAV